MPRCIIIAGPNGAGKTSLARDLLVREDRLIHFVNADLIASGISPLKPELAAVTAGRILLQELDRLAGAGEDFALESTLSGQTYVERIKEWKRAGYEIEIIYVRLRTPQLALRRIASRVREGGHNVPADDVLRRFERSWANFSNLYKPLADVWSIYDNSGAVPCILEHQP